RGSALIAWLAPSLGQREATKLIAMVGEDQLLLANEVQKLTTYAGDRPVTCEDIENLVMLSTEKAVWQLMDLLGAKKREEALQFTETILKRGENPHGLWSMFLWMVAQFSQVAAQVIEGNTNPQSIAKACGMHPNTARNLISLAQSYDHKRLLHLITLVIDSDIKLKTGGFKATDQSPEELNAILDTRIAAVI
ncbi:MAG: hypothetical protein KC680_04220, partial [Candidatus Peregrinibacteria bacterium]|nr:hypothetical protein [Candidatus Peregrinibacteria bacterium]